MNSFRLAEWDVFPDLNRLRRGEDVIELEPRAMAVLEELARVPGRVVTRQDLHRSVWSDVIVTEDALNRCITQLRRVLGDDARAPRFIETISKRGYRLIAPVSAPGESVTDGVTSGEPSTDVEAHVLQTGLLGHRAELAAEISPEEWRRLLEMLSTGSTEGGDAMVLHREDVVLRATPVPDGRRFSIRTRTLAAAAPAGTAAVAFVIAALLLWGRQMQGRHGLGIALASAVAGWVAGSAYRRRALDASRAAIEAFRRAVLGRIAGLRRGNV